MGATEQIDDRHSRAVPLQAVGRHAVSADQEFRVGVDIGGTFTDFVVLKPDQAKGQEDILAFKVPSTPNDPSVAVLSGLQELSALGFKPSGISFFSHGTTVATNALLEGKGASVGLLVTRHFRAVQEVQDQTRGAGSSIYDLSFERPPLLVPQERTGEVPGRLDYRGEEVVQLDAESTREEIRRLIAAGADSFAVCLLFSFMNPSHEQAVRRLINEEAPSFRVSLSSDVLPVIREWFRLSTTQINAYVAPRLFEYLNGMEEKLKAHGVVAPQRFVMQSNGGVTSFASAADKAVTTVLSGPAAGVIAGSQLALAAGYPNCITFDIGGTSTDISVVEAGVPVETTTGKVAGYDVRVPMLDICTISAGGGTIAWVDRAGTLRCGPHSAGADPGPACYRKGGSDATITDANVVLGYLSPDYFLGGKVAIDAGKAEDAIARDVAEPLGLGTEQAAAGVLRLINMQMAEGVRSVSYERGHDVRDFAIVAFGGAGPTHASAVAAELGVPWVIVPPRPGLTSAMGLLMSDVKHSYARSLLRPLSDLEPEEAGRILADLDTKALSEMRREGFDLEEVSLAHEADLRYAGQGYELRVTLPSGPPSRENLSAARDAFDDLHERLHGHRADGEPVELVSLRTVSVATAPKIELREFQGDPDAAAATAQKGSRRAWFAGRGWQMCPVYERELLTVGVRLPGPAIVEQPDSTTLVQPDQTLSVDGYGNLILHFAEADWTESGRTN